MVFFLTSVRDVVKFVMACTLGHSITLIIATFLGITANYHLIDAVIALSVVYKGFDNTDGFRRYLDVRAPNPLAVVFAFGLIHGFGLSTRLQQLPLGEPGLAMLGRIVAFDVGVEVGQIVALIVRVLLLEWWRRFLMRLRGYLHTTSPGE